MNVDITSLSAMNHEIQDLQRELSDTRPKLPFMVKVLRALHFEKDHPDSANVIGTFWTDDTGSFVTNAKILSEFLQVKPNSINANFREHGFTTPQSVDFEQLRRFRTIFQRYASVDKHAWKQRKHRTDAFKSTTTLDEAAVLSAESWSVFRGQQIRRSPLEHSANDQARDQWFQHLPSVESVRMEMVLPAFLPQWPNDNPQYVHQLRINCAHLCSVWRDAESLMKGTISITSFVSFFRCFGSPIGIRRQIEEITVPDSEVISTTMSPRFIDGICIGFRKSLISERWATASPETWALIEGVEEGTFRLLTRCRRVDMDQDKCRTIWIDTYNVEKRLRFK
jgi:hypothetical protein